jgi:hypothetical protein
MAGDTKMRRSATLFVFCRSGQGARNWGQAQVLAESSNKASNVACQ